ncbi:Recombinase [Parafrankia sp. EAN1pec]|nr:Recombinase [Frankia sp. EAN1pec]
MELEKIINLVERKGVDLATVTAGEVDLSTATGRAAARIVGAMARHESEQKAERLRRQKQQAAEKGLVSGGGHRAFGYERDGLTIREPEAELIREAADRVLAGETIASVCRDFEARDIRTTAGNWWKPLTLRQMLCSARISGRREHRPGKSSTAIIGEIVADAVWPGIISTEDSDELRAQLGRTGTGRITGATGRVYLLSGILRCGICTGRISGHNTGRGRRYYCPGAPGSTSCGRLTMGMDRTDIHIRDTVLLALDSPDFRERLHRRAKVDPAIRTSVKNDERLLSELDEDRTAGRISRARWLQMSDTVNARLETNRRKLAAVPSLRALEGLDGSYEEMLPVWEARNISQRRAIVTACVSHIIVNRAARRGPVFDPDRFDPQWLV